MNIEELKKSGNIIFECISGSRAYYCVLRIAKIHRIMFEK